MASDTEDWSFRRHGNRVRGQVSPDEVQVWPPTGEFVPLPLPLPLPVLPPVEARSIFDVIRKAVEEAVLAGERVDPERLSAELGIPIGFVVAELGRISLAENDEKPLSD
jgi:hypothetical protein